MILDKLRVTYINFFFYNEYITLKGIRMSIQLDQTEYNEPTYRTIQPFSKKRSGMEEILVFGMMFGSEELR